MTMSVVATMGAAPIPPGDERNATTTQPNAWPAMMNSRPFEKQ